MTPPSSQFSLPTPATTADLKNTRLFPESLVPVGGTPTAADNAALSTALLTYAPLRDVTVLENFVSANASSPWLVSILTNLGLIEFQNGYFSKALADWKQAWTLGKSAKDPAAQAVVDRAVAELINLYNRVGRFAESKALLAQLDNRSFSGLTATMIREERQSVSTMELHPADAFKCGPFAVFNILNFLHQQTSQTSTAIKDFATTKQGTSLEQVLTLANQLGVKMQAAKRVSGTALPLPAVVNWKLNHYGALLRQDGNRYQLVDPTFGTQRWVLQDAVNQEASGYFLIPAGPLPTGWVAVDAKEAGTVWGRGDGPNKQKGQNGKKTPKTPNGNCPPGNGMAAWTFDTMLASLNIIDTPLAYTPPIGAPVAFTVNYDAMEQNQPSTINYSNLGPLWNFSWLSSLTFEVTALPGTNAIHAADVSGSEPYDADVDIGDGGGIEHYTYEAGTQTYDPDPEADTTLVEVSPSDYERRAPDGSKMVFALTDSSGRFYLTQNVDSQGNAVTMSYDSNFRLVGLTDAIGQVTTLSYVSNTVGDPLFYRIAKVTDPFGRFASFTYNADGLLSQITDEIGMSSQFTYGTDNFIQTLTTPYGTTSFTLTETSSMANGTVTSLVATEPDGAQQRVDSVEISTTTADTEKVAPAGMTLANQYLEFRNSYFWNRKAMHDAPGDYTKAALTHFLHYLGGAVESGIVESTKEPLENRVWYFYQGQDPTVPFSTNAGMLANPIEIGQVLDDGTTKLQQHAYNTLGNVTQSIDPMGRITNCVYAANGIDPITILQVNGNSSDVITSYTWNNQHLPLTVAGADGEASTMTYNTQGQVLTLTDAKGEMSTNTYDANGYLLTIQGPVPGATDLSTFTYDSFGRTKTFTDGEGYVRTFGYDALNRLTSVTYPDGTSDQDVYTFLQPTQLIDRLGRTTTYTYNGLQQLVSMTDPLNRVTRYKRCSCGALLAMIDPLGQTTSWDYDVQGRPTAKTFADGSKETYTYEATSRLKTIKDAKNQVKLFTYNPDDSLATTTYLHALQPTPGVSYTYDPIYARIASITDGIGKTVYTYNPVPGGLAPGANRVASISGPLANSQVTYNYDELGRILSRSINGTAQTVTFDTLGRIPTLVNPLGTFDYTYENSSTRITNIAMPNGQARTATFFGNNGDHRLQQIKNLNVGGSSLSEFDYTYNAVGNVLTQTLSTDGGAGTTSTMGYDAADQLTSATATGQTRGYTYDVAGNRLTQTVNSATTTATYNGLNQTQQVSPALGNDKTYLWDAENRLIQINYTGTSLSTKLSYDGENRCVQIVELNGSTVTSTKRFVWCGQERCEEHDASDNVTRRFFNEGEQVTGTNYFYTQDRLDSICEMTDTSGALHARYSYDPYGTRTKVSGDLDATAGFSGLYFHAPSGLEMAVFRAYDAATGRWLSRDPLGEGASPNLYAYVGNSPGNSIDPSGLIKIDIGDISISQDGISYNGGTIGPKGLSINPGDIMTGPILGPAKKFVDEIPDLIALAGLYAARQALADYIALQIQLLQNAKAAKCPDQGLIANLTKSIADLKHQNDFSLYNQAYELTSKINTAVGGQIGPPPTFTYR